MHVHVHVHMHVRVRVCVRVRVHVHVHVAIMRATDRLGANGFRPEHAEEQCAYGIHLIRRHLVMGLSRGTDASKVWLA